MPDLGFCFFHICDLFIYKFDLGFVKVCGDGWVMVGCDFGGGVVVVTFWWVLWWWWWISGGFYNGDGLWVYGGGGLWWWGGRYGERERE